MAKLHVKDSSANMRDWRIALCGFRAWRWTDTRILLRAGVKIENKDNVCARCLKQAEARSKR